jgi:type VI secretion system protein VasD
VMEVVLKRALMGATLGAAVWALAGCAGTPQPKPAAASEVLSAAPDVNPDETGRASPIVVRVYELKQADAFESAGYFALMDHERQTLGDSLIHREEYELSPGQTRTVALTIAVDAHYIAAIAGYRQIMSARWKALAPVPAQWLLDHKHPHRVTIQVGRAAVAVVE